MKTPMGTSLAALFISLWGLAAFRMVSIAEHSSRPLGEDVQLVGLGLLCFLAAGAIWVRHPSGLRIYFVWTTLWLAAGCLTQYLQEVPPWNIAAWFGVTGTAFGVIGIYLKIALEPRPNEPLHLTS